MTAEILDQANVMLDEGDWFAASESDDPKSSEKPPQPILAARPPSKLEASALFFDIETVPDESRLESFGLDPLPILRSEMLVAGCPPVEAVLKSGLDEIERQLVGLNPEDAYLDMIASAERASAKPRAGIEKAIQSVKAARDRVKNAAGERQKLLSVTPEYCRLAALGWAVGGCEPESLTCGEHADCDTTDERKLLEAFWSLAMESKPLIGFNVTNFDLRVIFVRSAILGVPPSLRFDTRPWSGEILDLMELRFGRSPAMGLKKLAPLYGIEVPAGDVDGSQVAGLMATDPKAVASYVKSDVHVTRELYRRFSGYFCP